MQGTGHLPKCDNANLEQSLQEVRASGGQRGRTLQEVSLGKEQHALFLLAPFSLYNRPAEGEHDLISSHLTMPTLIQLLGPMPIFTQSSLTMILSACSASLLKVATGQA